MSGIEIVTRNSLSSLRSSSQARLLIENSVFKDLDDRNWSWQYLKDQFQQKGAEGLFYRYQARVQHALYVGFLMLNMVYYAACLILLFLLSQEPSAIVLEVSLRLVGLVTHLIIFILAYKESLFQTSRVRLIVPWFTVLIMMCSEYSCSVSDLVTVWNQPAKIFHQIRPTFYIILCIYAMLPFPKNYQSAIASCIVSLVELILSGLEYHSFNSKPKSFAIMIAPDIVFYLVICVVGISVRLLLELMCRRAFMDRRECIESIFLLKKEKEREETLLQSILPKYIAHEVKNAIRGVILQMKPKSMLSRPFDELYVKQHHNVSILYADIVNSVVLTNKLKADELVMTLNLLFGRFDEIAEKNNCLRIKLLGDCYYCVSGVTQWDPNHAKNCVQMGLEMIDTIRSVREELRIDVDMRIGVHSGNVLSGLIGLRKWHFDIWSQDVTIASHMEQAGKAGRVHISEATLEQLDNNYVVEPAYGCQRDILLKKMKIETFFIVGHKKKVTGNGHFNGRRSSFASAPVVARAQVRSRKMSSGSDILSLRRRTVLDYSISDYQKMVESVNKDMDNNINSMALSKKDQWCNSKEIEPFLLFFRGKNLEKPYLKQVDPLFKYCLLCVLLLFLGMAVIQMLTVTRSLYIWSCFSLAFVVIGISCLSTWTGYLQAKCKNSVDDHLSSSMSSLMSRVANQISKHFMIRILLWFMISLLMFLCALIGMADCVFATKVQLNNNTMFSYTNSTVCEYRWYNGYSAILAMTATSVFLRINYALKFVINSVSLAVYIVYTIREEESITADRKVYFSDWYKLDASVTINQCIFLVIIFVTLFVMDRQIEYICRLDYLWKNKFNEGKEETRIMGLVNRLLLQNILPVHVTDFYLSHKNLHSEDIYHEEYQCAGVMFASIPNYMIFDTGNYGFQEGPNCLQLLNKIICNFDKLLYETQFLTIEKIKTIGSTYMVSAGLQPGKGSIEVQKEEHSEENVQTLVQFAMKMMNSLDLTNKEDLQNLKLRVGIAVGPLIAGVVGPVKPQYDIWGDTVNMASRMESTGIPGHIQVTNEVAELLMNQHQEYILQKREGVYVKGKGYLTTYLLKTAHDDPVSEDSDVTRL
ncbi:adenylate cyclase type 2-like isoform X2 [Tachypleus tridentatus]|uniref:adenylate cyclase type 2-like isoform X2 n=1 Tax=Tachypleus tridentatus TaxID=6853 RepID=UPI003FD1DF9F